MTLGPLYHLIHSSDRLAALQEAFRVLRPGGVLIVEAISRYLPLIKVLSKDLLDDARMASLITRTLHTGQHRPDPDLDFFTTAFFSPSEWTQTRSGESWIHTWIDFCGGRAGEIVEGIWATLAAARETPMVVGTGAPIGTRKGLTWRKRAYDPDCYKTI